MKKKSILVGALLAQSMFTFADVNFTLSDLKIAAGETKTVTVGLDITDATKLSNYEMVIELPEGLHFKDFDSMETPETIMGTTDYDWTLSRSAQGTYTYFGRTYVNKVKFIAFTMNQIADRLSKESGVDVAFTFDVVADQNYNDKVVAPIVMHDVKAADFANGAPDYKIDGEAEGDKLGKVNGGEAETKGTVTRLYKLDSHWNYIMVNGSQTPDAIDLTPTHEQTITINLYNYASIRGLQGVIRIPSFLTFSDKGNIVLPRTKNELLSMGTPVLKGDYWERTFLITTSEAKFRDMNEYGTALLQFKVKGNNVEGENAYNKAHSGEITFDTFKATLNGSYNTVTMDDVITLTVNNPNQVAKDTYWDPMLENFQKQLDDQIALINSEYSNFRNFPNITNQEEIAQKAIDALKEAVQEAYELGKLVKADKAEDVNTEDELDDSYDFTKLINDADKQINDILNKEIEKGKEAAAANNKMVEDALTGVNPEVPTPPTEIKADDSVEPIHTIHAAKMVYEDAIGALKDFQEQAAVAGTQANEKVYEEKLKAVFDAVDNLKLAIETVQKKADANNKKLENAINLPEPDGFALPAYVSKDNGKLGETGSWTEAKEALLQVQKDAAEKSGTQAKDGVYDEAIANLGEALEKVKKDAAANNALVDAATKSYEEYDYANDNIAGVAIDYELEEDDPVEVYASVMANEEVKKAIEDYDAAYQALLDKQAAAGASEDEVEDEELKKIAGTQAKDGIYAAELENFYDKQNQLKETIKEKIQDASANQAEVEDHLALGYTSGRGDIFDTQEVAAAMEAWENAKEELEKALENSKENGLLADDQYKDENGEPKLLDELIKNVDKMRKALQDAIDAANDIANEIDNIITAGMDKLNDEIQGRGGELLSELEKAKVVDPATVKQEEGKLPTTASQYAGLLGELRDLIFAYNPFTKEGGLQSKVMAEKAKYLEGKIDIDQLRDYLDDNLVVDKDQIIALKKEAIKIIVDYLKTVQRGDVGGDGRWTTNDYARLRKVILSEEYPTAPRDDKGELDVEKIEFDDANPDTEELYEFYRMDINQDGTINVGDAQGALNYTFYGSMLGPVAEARTAENSAETMSATMNGNVIAVALNNSRQYSAMQLDVVLAEGMTVTGAKVAGRTADFSVATGELKNGATRILLTADEAGKAFEGSEGAVLFIEVAGQGQVEFQNIILADLTTATAEFALNGVSGGTTGINSANAKNGVEEVYSLGGRVMNALKKGVNIIRRADGSTQKVLKK